MAACELTRTAIKTFKSDVSGLALTCLEARVYFVDDVNTAATTYHTVCAVTTLKGF